MADMIDASEAKKILNCDDEALNNHINAGSIRAQRVGAKLMLSREDVEKLAKDDDGTIVLTGDSDNLSIDLGKVVDDTSETMVQSKKNDGSADSITFGDELEVVNFDDGNTKDLAFDNKNTTDLNFTDSNTAVMTSVDETNVGATTAPVDFQTDPAAAEPARPSGESRRSVRSARARAEIEPIHWIWTACMAASVAIIAFAVVPYYFLAMWPQEERDAVGGTYRGVADSGFASIAGMAARFTVEPDRQRWVSAGHDADGYRDIAELDPTAKWVYLDYRGGRDRTAEKRFDDVYIEAIKDDQAVARSGKTYPIIKGTTENEADRVNLGTGSR